MNREIDNVIIIGGITVESRGIRQFKRKIMGNSR